MLRLFLKWKIFEKNANFPSPNLQLILNSTFDEFCKKVRDCIVSEMVDLLRRSKDLAENRAILEMKRFE